MSRLSFVKTIQCSLIGYLWLIAVSLVLANDQVQFSTKSNLLTIPSAIIDQYQIVFDAEMQLQPSGLFALIKYSEQPAAQISIDEPFILAMDQTAWIKNTNLRLKLTAITEDSRCPIETNCFAAGTAIIVLALFNGIEHIRDYQLTTDYSSSNSVGRIGGLAIQLIDVFPSPSSIPLKSADYSAYFVINKSSVAD